MASADPTTRCNSCGKEAALEMEVEVLQLAEVVEEVYPVGTDEVVAVPVTVDEVTVALVAVAVEVETVLVEEQVTTEMAFGEGLTKVSGT